jgi:hypothetical protein
MSEDRLASACLLPYLLAPMSFILALDQGTTSSRAILFDQAGAIRASAHQEFPQLFPQTGWVEHDPLEIWSSQLVVARTALAQAGPPAGDVSAIGITNQRETAVIWDRRSGEPIHNAIVWQDRRTAGFCDDLKRAGHGDLITRKTGLVIDAYFSGSKIRWLLDHVPGARERARRGELAFGTVDTWLLWKLTGGALHLTDPSNASRTLLFNLHTGAWDEELLRLLDVPRELLPEVRSSSEVYGETAPELFGVPVAIAGIAGDQQAALFGQSCFSRGLAKNTYGTGCFMLMNTGSQPVASRHQLLTTVAWKMGAQTDYAWTEAQQPTTCSCNSRQTSCRCRSSGPKWRRRPPLARLAWPAWRLAFGKTGRKSGKPGSPTGLSNPRRAPMRWRIAAAAGVRPLTGRGSGSSEPRLDSKDGVERNAPANRMVALILGTAPGLGCSRAPRCLQPPVPWSLSHGGWELGASCLPC